MIIKGYKAFNSDRTNRYGKIFREGRVYHNNNDLKFGNNGHGFHMCSSLCDVFRYFDSDVSVAKVIGFGNFVSYDDEYYGYYDMYVVTNLYIEKFLTREEIITQMLNSSPVALKKFLSTFTLNDIEKNLFLEKYKNDEEITNLILYYQFGIDVYHKDNCLKRIKKRTNN